MYQGRLNLAEQQQTEASISSTKYSETFSSPGTNFQKIPHLTKPNQLDSKLNLTRDSTFLVEKGVYSKEKSYPRRALVGGDPPPETRIPTLLGRKYSDDSLLKNGFSPHNTHSTSKSTPNIVAEQNGSSSNLPAPQTLFKRFSTQNPGSSQISTFSQTPSQQTPRKFSYSFPPPESKDLQNVQNLQNSQNTTPYYLKDFRDENGNAPVSKLFQPLPVTTLTFSLGGQHGLSGISGYHPYSLTKSPNPPFFNANASKRSPSPTGHVPRLKNGESGTNTNSSYFPHTHFSSNVNTTTGGGRYPVSFYQGNTNTVPNPKSLPVSVYGSSMVLKNHVDFTGNVPNGENSSFLPRMTGKTFTSSGGSVKDEEGNSLSSKKICQL